MPRSASPTSPTLPSGPRKKRVHINHLPIFHPDQINSEDDLIAAAQEMEGYTFDSTQIPALLDDLMSGPRLLLEVVLSSTNGAAFNRFSAHILQDFPQTAASFNISLAATILSRLSLSLFFLPCASKEKAFLQDRRLVELTSPVLRALASSTFAANESGSPVEPEGPEEEFDVLFKVKSKKSAKSQKQAKREKKSVKNTLDPRVFDALEEPVPTSAQEAEAMVKRLLGEQKEILSDYLDLIRQPEYGEDIRAAYLPKKPSDTDQLDREEATEVTSVAAIVSTTASSAYPMVQPMKASLYFESADGFGEWRILISTRADRDLRDSRKKNPKLFKIYIKKIKELSRGYFSSDNQKKLTGHNTDSIDIFEAKMTGDSRLVYQVHVVPDYDSEVERQVLRIFGIYTHAQLDQRFWASMGYQLARKGKEYQKRCKFRNRPVVEGDYVVAPASWPEPVDQTELELVSDNQPLRPEDLDELHSLLVLEKFVTFSQALLNSIIADHDVAHVFAVSPKEKEIIEHSASCYVLGRSGTGKTTTMLFKILGIQRAWENCRDTMPKPRQIFVTQSRVLAGKVNEYFAKLLHSLAAGSQTREELAQIAATKEPEARRMVDEDDQDNWRSDLPQQFSALKDEHFPLFITFDKMCKLLEADILAAAKEQADVALKSPSMDRKPQFDLTALSPSATLVSYYRFLQEYWAHFPQSLTKGLDPALVYSEFMGIIKGSEQTMDYEEGYLDKKAYLALSHRANSTFAAKRELVYGIFQSYAKRKRELGDFDPADRSRVILRHIQSYGLAGAKIDFLYVDEAQDNLLIDALLLRAICRNPDGLFWAGDTAQTISVGSSFRFNDLKAFLYRVEEKLKQRTDYIWSPTDPKAFQLTVNYRSHGGIVNCAHSVIQIISQFWPYAIDDLASEEGIIDGLKPLFFHGWDQDTIRYEQFLFGAAGEHMEFGAQQCILVRDDAARDKLRSQVGDIGLIMTLYESKGLEFNDVLLYNFFEDSTVNLAQWRVVLNMIDEDARGAVKAPHLDDTRHAGVCSELKFLYVAITRARKNMWIVDPSEKGEPLRKFWMYKGLISTCTPGMDVPRLAVQSTAEEWAEQGHSLFKSRRFAQAMHSFDRAGLQREMNIANAYHLRERARLLQTGSRQAETERNSAFILAADAFQKCASAGGNESQTYYRNAGECYSRAGVLQRAARAYLEAAEYTLSAQHFRKAGLFDDAVNVVQAHRQNVEPTFAEVFIDTARLYYFQEKNLEKANCLFATLEEELEFLDDCGMDIAQATLLESLGRVAEAAEIHALEGRVQQAIQLLLSDRDNAKSVKRAKDLLLDHLWKQLSFGVTSTVRHRDEAQQKKLIDLLALSNRLNVSLLETEDIAELAMFDAIFQNNLDKLRDQAVSLLAANGDIGAVILCLDHFYTSPPKIKTANTTDVSASLGLFHDYIRLLKRVATDANAVDNPVLRRLFAIQESDQSYLLPAGSYLHKFALEHQVTVIRATMEGAFMTPRETTWTINQAIARRLKIRIAQEDAMALTSRAFSPICLSSAVYNLCNRPDCVRRHIDAPELSAAWYSEQIVVFFRQFVILQMMHSQMTLEERAPHRKGWLLKLYDALYPAHHYMGTPSVLQLTPNIEIAKAAEVVKDWLTELVYTLDPKARQNQATFLTFFMRALSMHLVFTPPPSPPPDYLRRAYCMTQKGKPAQFIRTDRGDDILRDFCGAIFGDSQLSLVHGTLFINWVLKNGLLIDLSVLCDFVDHLLGSIVIAYRLNMTRTFHDITLPRNWFLRLVPSFKGAQPKMLVPGLFNSLIDFLAAVLVSLAIGRPAQGLLFEGKDVASYGPLVRNIFIYRICRALCLMGYNVGQVHLRNRIRLAVTSIRQPGRRTPDIYAKYTDALDWDSLAKHVRSSNGESSLDEMIRLLHRPKLQALPTELRGTRNLYFYNEDEVVPLLISGRSSTLRVEASPFVPKVLAASATEEDSAKEPGTFEEDPLEGDVQLNPEQQGKDADASTTTFEAISIVKPDNITIEETRAATLIQRTYRKALRIKHRTKHSGLQAAREAYFLLCASAASKMEWPLRSQYRLFFLGPMAHVLVSADRIHHHAHTAKQKAKKQLNDLRSHENLEEARARQTKANELFKKALALKKIIDLEADIHRLRDTEALKTHILALQALAETLPPGTMQEFEHDLALAIKSIVTPAAPLKKEKPELVVDDEDLY